MRAMPASRQLTLAGLAALLVLVSLVVVGLGPIHMTTGEAASSVARLLTGHGHDSGSDLLIAAVRAPRVLTAVLVGAALGIAGAAMQTVFHNPLAEPGITGVSSGAAVAAVLLIVTGGARIPGVLPLGAFLGAMAVAGFIQVFSLSAPGRSSAPLLLVGIALNALLGAVVSAVITNAPQAEQARSALFWLNGDLTGRSMDDVRMATPPIVIGVLALAWHTRELNLLSLGDATAQTSGLDVRACTRRIIAAAALATAGGVAVTGIISFVGLVIPHIVRLIWGGDHRFVMPASALLAAIFLVIADTIARMAFSPVSVQTGTVTALVGAPFLLALVLRDGGVRQ
ncbi:iron complex transport system permease protein [Propionibacterium cyclohexanicum]|uniref:Iron complex transport system permease protein n=1 Tax=Propionibacterium cyclohexanicum TaxID=64702 RepID=A0A1H9RXX4_9ACTN|nr:iron ABC transporter permease [Propionibacterium cyclohexanicum]SER77611.1 iron complex transport system permease protein [Propionibacterium cyclohexanicum]